jgi:hypothetical protein
MLIPGTWSSSDEWWRASSSFARFLQLNGFELIGAERPFTWTTSVNGLLSLRKGGKFIDWKTGGDNLYAYLEPPISNIPLVSVNERNLIAHSHGGQVVRFALAAGLQINNLVTIGTPVRDDMRPIWEKALLNIKGHWTHITSSSVIDNWWSWVGALFDGHLGLQWEFDFPGVRNIDVANIGHSRILYNPDYFHLWLDQGWLKDAV